MSNASTKTATISKPKKKPAINSRAKGARGERELAKFLQAHGFQARRGQQNAGGPDSPDVNHDIPGVHIECKRTETLSLYVAMAQAIRDAGAALTPTVWHKRNGKDWLVILRAEDFLSFARLDQAYPLSDWVAL
jgi:Holliday junction resolvase